MVPDESSKLINDAPGWIVNNKISNLLIFKDERYFSSYILKLVRRKLYTTSKNAMLLDKWY